MTWRGTVGVVKPTRRPGSLEEFIRLLPEGIGVLPEFLSIREGTEAEFRAVLDSVEGKVAELAASPFKVDLIHPEGAPPFMVQGFEGERRIVGEWEQKYGLPIWTSGQTQVDAMRALEVRRIVGITYFTGTLNDVFAQYFRDAGFEVLAMEGMQVGFADTGHLSAYDVYAHAKRAFLAHEPADAIYMLGSGWRVLDIIQMLEDDLRTIVVHPTPARV